MRIKVIVPITTEEFVNDTISEIKELDTQAEIDVEGIKFGTASIESMYDEALCEPGIISLAEKTQAEGYDGIFITCMGDPALDAVREKLDIPVVGPARVSMLYAAELAHKFSVVTVLENVVVLIEQIAVKLGIERKLASVRSVNIPVLDLTDRNILLRELINESVKAIDEDKAHAIILGCTGMIGVGKQLQEKLHEKRYDVPVIAPVLVSIKYLESLISLQLKQSSKTYMKPTEKDRNILHKLEN